MTPASAHEALDCTPIGKLTINGLYNACLRPQVCHRLLTKWEVKRPVLGWFPPISFLYVVTFMASIPGMNGQRTFNKGCQNNNLISSSLQDKAMYNNTKGSIKKKLGSNAEMNSSTVHILPGTRFLRLPVLGYAQGLHMILETQRFVLHVYTQLICGEIRCLLLSQKRNIQQSHMLVLHTVYTFKSAKISNNANCSRCYTVTTNSQLYYLCSIGQSERKTRNIQHKAILQQCIGLFQT